MNKLPREKQESVLRCLLEGNSIRSTGRITGVNPNTVTSLMVRAGKACAAFHNEKIVQVEAKRIQCDEVWAFCYCKQKNAPLGKIRTWGYGDVWTWTAIDADTKLIISYLVGDRGAACAIDFMQDVAYRVNGRPQLTTDGLQCYLNGVAAAFNNDLDYAMLDKVYGKSQAEIRYSPPVLRAISKKPLFGNPEYAHISTSFVERQNLTMRMSMRRFTRLTNAFSKKVDNHGHAVALYFVFYNWCRVHLSLSVTPAMEAGLTDRVWELSDVLDYMEEFECKSN